MTKIKYIDADKNVTSLTIEPGETIMSLAINNMVAGIEGECGGALACATCHCFIDEKFASQFSAIDDMEDAMLDMLEEREPNSRLSCQLELTDETTDIEVHLPMSQC